MLQATNIKWDTDGNEKLFQALPSTVDIPEGILGDDEIADYLSDTVGFCHSGYKLTSVVSEDITNVIFNCTKFRLFVLSSEKWGEKFEATFQFSAPFTTSSDWDACVNFCYNGTDRDFIEKFQNYANTFSVEEYVSVCRKHFTACWIKNTLTTIAENLQSLLPKDVSQETTQPEVTEKAPKTDQWNYVDEVGKPTEPGIYIVTLIYSECEHGERTGRKVATIDSRDLVDLDKNPSLVVWAMSNEPKTGLAWLDETGDGLDARVYAWLPKQKPSAPKLPEGVVLDE